jgi:aminocarboxymuconate-semialdehyde decarboxylase
VRIDVHNHVIPRAAIELFERKPSYGVRIEGGFWHGGVHVDFPVPPAFLEPDAKLAELDDKGIDAAVLSAAPPLFYYHVDSALGRAMAEVVNHGLAEFAAAAPRRLSWMATVPLQDPAAAIDVLRDAGEAGAVGVEVGTSVDGRRLDEPECDAFWAEAEQLGLPVLIHPAYNGHHPALEHFYLSNVIGNLLETTIAVERLICAHVFDRHPGVRVVLAHSGGYFPYQAGRLKHARSVRPELAASPEDPWTYLDRLWFDTITHDGAALRYLVARVGVERVVLGTDLPFDMAPQDPLGELARALDADAVELVTVRNPALLYNIDQGGTT